MSSTTVSVPKYRHHKGSGQALIQIKGRRYYLGKWNSPESKERYARFVAEEAVSPVPSPLPFTPHPAVDSGRIVRWPIWTSSTARAVSRLVWRYLGGHGTQHATAKVEPL